MFETNLMGKKKNPAGNLLFHFDGVNNSTTFPNEYPNSPQVASVLGAPKISNKYSKFGGTSIALVKEQLTLSSKITLNGDYTIECFIYLEVLPPNTRTAIASNSKAVSGDPIHMALTLTPKTTTYVAGLWIAPNLVSKISQSAGLPLNQWNHIASVRKGDRYMVFESGIMVIDITSPVVPVIITGLFGWLLANRDYSATGWIDEFRLLDGKAEYFANFTPPTTPFTI